MVRIHQGLHDGAHIADSDALIEQVLQHFDKITQRHIRNQPFDQFRMAAVKTIEQFLYFFVTQQLRRMVGDDLA